MEKTVNDVHKQKSLFIMLYLSIYLFILFYFTFFFSLSVLHKIIHSRTPSKHDKSVLPYQL